MAPRETMLPSLAGLNVSRAYKGRMLRRDLRMIECEVPVSIYASRSVDGSSLMGVIIGLLPESDSVWTICREE